MFEIYTEKAKRVIFFARLEAGEMGAAQIGAEHLLLGLIRQDQPLLERLAGGPLQIEAVRQEISDHAGSPEVIPSHTDMPLNTSAKLALESTAEESQRLKHRHIGTEHMLVGLLLEEASWAAQFLREMGLSIEKVRDDLAKPSDGA